MLVWLSFIDNESLCPGLSGTALLWFSLGSYLSIKKPTSFGKIPMNIVVVLAAVFFVCRLLVMGNVIDGIWGDILNITWILTSMAFYFRLAYLMAERNVRVKRNIKEIGSFKFCDICYAQPDKRSYIICFAFHGRETECGRLAYHNILFRYHNSYCGHMLLLSFDSQKE